MYRINCRFYVHHGNDNDHWQQKTSVIFQNKSNMCTQITVLYWIFVYIYKWAKRRRVQITRRILLIVFDLQQHRANKFVFEWFWYILLCIVTDSMCVRCVWAYTYIHDFIHFSSHCCHAENVQKSFEHARTHANTQTQTRCMHAYTRCVTVSM